MLERIGFKENWIYEILMETGDIHRAPIGIWTEDFKHFFVDIYKDSSTYSNLAHDKKGRVYVVDDPRYFSESRDIDYLAKFDFEVVEEGGGNPRRFMCSVKNLEIKGRGEPLNRARGLFLEFLVDYSRRNVDIGAGKRLKLYKRTIKKVAPGSVYEKLLKKYGKG
jgi:hypothetical protein